MGIVQELKERRLVQIVVFYATVGWLALEIAQSLPQSVFPDVAYYIALVWYFAGLLVVGIIGWHHGEKGSQKTTRGEVVSLSLIGIAALGASGVVFQRVQEAEAAGAALLTGGGLSPTRVAVLYFEDRSRDDSLSFVSEGLTESLISELSEVPLLDVVTRNGVAQFRGSPLSRDSIARILDAGTLVTGAVEPAGDDLRVEFAIHEGVSGSQFNSGSLERPRSELLVINQELAQQVARSLREWLGEEIAIRRVSTETGNSAAWALLQRGERARKQLEQSLAEGNVQAAVSAARMADSQLAAAEEADPGWARPPAMRAFVEAQLTRMSADDPVEAGRYIDEGIAHAERSLQREPRFPPALEARGQLQYYRWVLGLARDPADAERLLVSAEEDLRTAVRLDPSRANAYNILSIISSQKPDLVQAKLDAQRAYEADAFLRSARDLVWRLYATSYDLEQFPDARQYCEEGRRRFPDDPRFVECELWLLASRGTDQVDYDRVARAWELQDELVRTIPPADSAQASAKSRIIVGGVIAREGMPDSAVAVFDRARPTPAIDPSLELLGVEAVFRLQMGQEAEALDLLRRYLTTSPEHRAGWQWSSHWWWRDLQDNPEFRDLMGSGG